MEVERINEFVELADDGNYHRTADKLFISQSALSKHIKSLEEDLGVPLLERNVTGVQLTDFGRIFYPYAKQISHLYTNFNREIEQKLQSLTGVVNIGTEYQINGLIRAFKRENPDFMVNLFPENSSQRLRADLRQGEFEIAFMYANSEFDEEFNHMSAFADELVLVTLSSDPLAKKGEPVSLAELKNRHFLLPTENTMLFFLIEKAFHAAGIKPVTVCTGLSASLAMDMAAEKIGVALLPRREAAYHLTGELSLVPLNPPQEMKIDLCFRKRASFSPGAIYFLNFLQTYRQSV